MMSADFDLQHADIPQPKEVDEDLASRDWPLPPVKPWAPAPRKETLLERIAEVFR